MDTTETYIKMCEKAKEIQKAWEPTAWDWVYCRPAGKEDQNPVVLSDYEVDGGYYGHSVDPECSSPISNGAYSTGTRNFREEHFFIPRQDQLQTLSGLSWYLFDKTCVTLATTNSDYQKESKEIVGLRVVMKLNYKKQWADSDWKLDNTI